MTTYVTAPAVDRPTATEPATATPWVGRDLTRVDGPHKIAGRAPYSSDADVPGMLHAALVTSTIAHGRVTDVRAAEALALAGVVDVLTWRNFPRLAPGPEVPLGWPPPPPLQDDGIGFHGQPVAVVLAETLEQAHEAARRVEVDYEEQPARLALDDAEPEPIPWVPDSSRGDTGAAWRSAAARVELEYRTAENVNNPLGLMGALAVWDGDRVDVHDSTQWPTLVRRGIATMFGVPLAGVRVRSPFLGGGFGAGLITWDYKVLAVGAARVTGRPVKLMLTRPQMFTQVGHRPETRQTLRVSAAADGTLTSVEHRALVAGAVERLPLGLVTAATAHGYACPNVTTSDRALRLHRRYSSAMRGPGEHEGNAALEVALDELAEQLAIDPVELRLRNLSTVDPASGLPWSSTALAECLRLGAERFGWGDRDPRPRSMRDGDLLVGWGVAAAAYGGYELPTSVRVTVYPDGSAAVRNAATDIGTGTYTIVGQIAADLLGLAPDQVDVDMGDTEMPPSAQSGGSALAGSVAHALHRAVDRLRDTVAELVATDADSALGGAAADELELVAGGVRMVGSTDIERWSDLLARSGLESLSSEGTVDGSDTSGGTMARAGAFGARFVEVVIDPVIGRLRVRRVVSVNDCGRVLNPLLARSQILGGTVGGIGAALFEDVTVDPDTGRVANGTLADYLVPTHADVPDIDVTFVGDPDRFTPTGVKGVGEVGLIGVAPAIANAVHHATGRRIRHLPIHLEDLLSTPRDRGAT
ncbi:xanthine dehydrogenase family protein molybdopterin-binding subunit [Actinomycetospora sp. OC33-EN08]|uniref:Xanthine dehydrogenase family protein molybdopterin-binding subunit n=1 Tax=Actinomycetospora aurantiaca TaxID=3129233 RepID=A0ABU8MUD5_9PSEU